MRDTRAPRPLCKRSARLASISTRAPDSRRRRRAHSWECPEAGDVAELGRTRLYDGVSSRGRFVFQTRGAGARRPARCRHRRRGRDVRRRRADVVAVHRLGRRPSRPLLAGVLVRAPLDTACRRRPHMAHHRRQPTRCVHRCSRRRARRRVDVHGHVPRRVCGGRPGLVRSRRAPRSTPCTAAVARPRRADAAPRAQHLRRAATSRRPRLRDCHQLLLRADRGAGGGLVARLVRGHSQAERAVGYFDRRADR